MAEQQALSAVFVKYAADLLGDTERGLSGPEIVKLTGAYAFEYGVNIQHETCPFAIANKRTALAETLMKFSEPQRYQIIKAVADHEKIRSRNGEAAEELKQPLVSRNGHFAGPLHTA